jgi:hypothetical protein
LIGDNQRHGSVLRPRAAEQTKSGQVGL